MRSWRAAIGAWLWRERGLRLKHPHARVLSCAGSLNVLGYRVRRDGFTALGRVHRRMRRRLAATLDGREGAEQRRSIAASAGVVLF